MDQRSEEEVKFKLFDALKFCLYSYDMGKAWYACGDRRLQIKWRMRTDISVVSIGCWVKGKGRSFNTISLDDYLSLEERLLAFLQCGTPLDDLSSHPSYEDYDNEIRKEMNEARDAS